MIDGEETCKIYHMGNTNISYSKGSKGKRCFKVYNDGFEIEIKFVRRRMLMVMFIITMVFVLWSIGGLM